MFHVKLYRGFMLTCDCFPNCVPQALLTVVVKMVLSQSVSLVTRTPPFGKQLQDCHLLKGHYSVAMTMGTN